MPAAPKNPVLRANCAKGKEPEEDLSDGVRLDITSGPAFDEPVATQSRMSGNLNTWLEWL
jgi:hypothetical protein